jgi:hypothetical protein
MLVHVILYGESYTGSKTCIPLSMNFELKNWVRLEGISVSFVPKFSKKYSVYGTCK